MRTFTAANGLALACCPFRALLHLPTWANRRAVFEGAVGHLVPGGRFAWNASAFDHFFAAAHDGRKAEDARIPQSSATR